MGVSQHRSLYIQSLTLEMGLLLSIRAPCQRCVELLILVSLHRAALRHDAVLTGTALFSRHGFLQPSVCWVGFAVQLQKTSAHIFMCLIACSCHGDQMYWEPYAMPVAPLLDIHAAASGLH